MTAENGIFPTVHDTLAYLCLGVVVKLYHLHIRTRYENLSIHRNKWYANNLLYEYPKVFLAFLRLIEENAVDSFNILLFA